MLDLHTAAFLRHLLNTTQFKPEMRGYVTNALIYLDEQFGLNLDQVESLPPLTEVQAVRGYALRDSDVGDDE